MTSDFGQSIGAQIKVLREQRQITGKDLAKQIGLSQSQMSRLEKGQRRIDTEILAKIAGALDVPPALFFGDAQGSAAETEPLTARREKELALARLHTELGKRIRHERRQRHLTVEDLARKTGHTRAYVQAVEEGRRNGLAGDFLRKACRLLAIDPFDAVDFQERIIRDLKTRVHQLDLKSQLELQGAELDTSEQVLGTPILVGDEDIYPVEFSTDGEPIAAVEGYLNLPDLVGRPTFAVRVAGGEMTGLASPSFLEGDLVVFATDRSARSGELAFVRFAGNRTTFRRIYHDDDSVFRLQALAPEAPPILLSLNEVASAWPLVAHIQLPKN